MMNVTLLLLLALPAWGAPSKSELSQDMTIKARAAGGAGVQVTPPTASKPVIDEVLRSLSLGRGAKAPAAERIRTGGDVARFQRPFPEPPFLALSPANAGLDVYEWEPKMAPGLASCRNAVLAPHLASATLETRVKMGEMAASGLVDGLVRGIRSPYAVDQ